MFNRNAFNRGAFNRGSSAKLKTLGYSGISLESKARSTVKKYNSSRSRIYVRSDINTLIRKYGIPEKSNIILSVKEVDGTNRKHFVGNISEIIFDSEGDQRLSGEEIMRFPDIELLPGEEITIDTCNMTVTLDGKNAIHYFEDESTFFELLNGINEIYVSSKDKGEIMVDVMWKDRWL